MDGKFSNIRSSYLVNYVIFHYLSLYTIIHYLKFSVKLKTMSRHFLQRVLYLCDFPIFILTRVLQWPSTPHFKSNYTKIFRIVIRLINFSFIRVSFDFWFHFPYPFSVCQVKLSLSVILHLFSHMSRKLVYFVFVIKKSSFWGAISILQQNLDGYNIVVYGVILLVIYSCQEHTRSCRSLTTLP